MLRDGEKNNREKGERRRIFSFIDLSFCIQHKVLLVEQEQPGKEVWRRKRRSWHETQKKKLSVPGPPTVQESIHGDLTVLWLDVTNTYGTTSQKPETGGGYLHWLHLCAPVLGSVEPSCQVKSVSDLLQESIRSFMVDIKT